MRVGSPNDSGHRCPRSPPKHCATSHPGGQRPSDLPRCKPLQTLLQEAGPRRAPPSRSALLFSVTAASGQSAPGSLTARTGFAGGVIVFFQAAGHQRPAVSSSRSRLGGHNFFSRWVPPVSFLFLFLCSFLIYSSSRTILPTPPPIPLSRPRWELTVRNDLLRRSFVSPSRAAGGCFPSIPSSSSARPP
jgi:hypothetical protein